MTLTYGDKYFRIPIIVLFAIAIGTSYAVRSCNEENTNHARFDPTTAARMYLPVSQDTTKPKPQQKLINSYTLHGMSDTLVNILWMQINSPIDVTPRNLNTLKEWVQRNLKQDTVTNKN